MATNAIVSYDATRQRPRRADARARAGRRRRTADARLRPPHHAVGAHRARSSRSTRRRRCSSAAPIGSATPTSQRRVVVSGSTGEGLKWLAEQEDADIVVFGSDYRTAAGHVAPQRSAQTAARGRPDRGRDRAGQLSRGAATADHARRRARRSRRRRRDRDRTRAGGLGRRDASPATSATSTCCRRLALRGARGPRDDQLAGAERDRELAPRRCWSSRAACRSSSARSPASDCTCRRRPAEEVRARASRLSWPRVRTLLISDLHLGGRLGHVVLTRPEPQQRLLRCARRRRPAGAARRHGRAARGPTPAGDGDRRAGPARARRAARARPRGDPRPGQPRHPADPGLDPQRGSRAGARHDGSRTT